MSGNQDYFGGGMNFGASHHQIQEKPEQYIFQGSNPVISAQPDQSQFSGGSQNYQIPFEQHILQSNQATIISPPNPPADINEVNAILKLAQYVVKNGLEFEAVVKQRELNNPLFSFLWENGRNHGYYKYAIQCFSSNIPLNVKQEFPIADDPLPIYERDELRSSLTAAMWISGQPVDVDRSVKDLKPEDLSFLSQLLPQMNGSREFISKARDFVINLIPDGGAALVYRLRKFVENLPDGRDAVSAFQASLFVIYILNDVFFSTRCSDLFKEECQFQLPSIIRKSSSLATTKIESDKVVRVVSIWESKGVFADISNIKIALDISAQLEVRPPSPFPLQVDSFSSTIKVEGSEIQPIIYHDPNQVISSQSMNWPAYNISQSLPLPQQQPIIPPQVQSFYPPPGVQNPSIQQPPLFFPHQPNQMIPQVRPNFIPPPFHPMQQMNTPGVPPQMNMMPFRNPLFQPPIPPNFAGMPPGVVSFQTQVFPVGSSPVPMGQDLGTMQVGVMVGLIKAALKGGAKPYAPIEVTRLPIAKNPHIEPGRLDVRLADFYKLLTLEDERREREIEREDRRREREIDMERRQRRESRERAQKSRGSVSRRDRDREKMVLRGKELIPASRAALETSITIDNVGYQALKKMGWQEGAGLGVKGTGIAEPVKSGGQADRSGIGVKSDSDMDIFEQYRRTKSYNNNR